MCTSPWGGSEVLWSQAAAQLKRSGHDVQASTMYWPQQPDTVTALAKHGVRVATYPSPDSISGRARHFWDRLSLGTRRSYARLRRFHPDLVVISQGGNSGGFGWAKICRGAAIPYVMIVHCNSEQWWFGDQFEEAVASYKGARKVFCVSRNNLEILGLQLGEPLLNGELVWSPYNVSTEPPPAWPDEHGSLRLACVSRIELAAKGQDVLLQTLARPEWRDRPLEVNLYGAGPDELVLRRMCATLRPSNVHFRGYVKDIREIWAQNHLLVLPSRYEGLPLALIEAMWCARPALVTNVGGNAELCVDGATGFVAETATVASISHALQRAWESREEWPRLGQAARERVENQVPRDPVGLFCDRLLACAVASHSGQTARSLKR